MDGPLEARQLAGRQFFFSVRFLGGNSIQFQVQLHRVGYEAVVLYDKSVADSSQPFTISSKLCSSLGFTRIKQATL